MKKKWIVAVAVIAVLAGYFISQGEASDKEAPNQGKPVTADTIQVPDGPKIEVVFNGPAELEVSWEELGMDGFQVVLKGTLKNVSSQTVSFDRINFSLDGDWIGKWPPLGGLTLEPKGETKIRGGGIYSSESSKNQILEVKIVGFKKTGDSAPTTSPQPETPKPSKQEPSETSKTIFTKAPNNPQTPAEVVAAFFFLCADKNSQAEKFLSQRYLQIMQSQGGLEAFYKAIIGDRQLGKIELFGVETINSQETWIDDLTLHFATGEEEPYIEGMSLIKEGGDWKIDQW